MDEHKTPGQNWKELDTKQKIVYFFDYYKLHAALGLLILISLFYMIWHTTHPAPNVVMRVFIFNDLLDETAKQEAQEALAEKFGVNPDAVYFDDGHEDNDVGSMQLATLLSLHDVDLVIGREERFRQLAGEGTFLDLETVLTKEQMAACADCLITAAGYEEPEDLDGGNNVEQGYGKGEVRPYGVRISVGRVYADMSLTGGEYYCGVVGFDANVENALLCLDYLMGDSGE